MVPKNTRAAPTAHLVLLGDGTHSEEDVDVAHLILVSWDTKVQVWQIGEHLATRSTRTKNGVGSVSPKEREREKEKQK